MKKLIVIMAAILTVAVGASASTHNNTVGNTNSMPAAYAGGTYVLESAELAFTSSSTGAAADVYQVIGIPAGTWVQKVAVEVTAAQTGSADIDIGDGDDTDGYYDGLTGSVITNWTTSTPGLSGPTNAIVQTGYTAFGRIYPYADTIDVLANSPMSNVTFKVKAFCVDFDDQ